MNTDGYNREMKKETSLFEGKHGIILIEKLDFSRLREFGKEKDRR